VVARGEPVRELGVERDDLAMAIEDACALPAALGGNLLIVDIHQCGVEGRPQLGVEEGAARATLEASVAVGVQASNIPWLGWGSRRALLSRHSESSHWIRSVHRLQWPVRCGGWCGLAQGQERVER
jgi:hypothetical protein